ncbi:spore coat protein YsxE [Geomicrobium halophilum]|uniref:Spore coat protein YsxE n=1 Tax=Geomicrobium halophilum TaxID=549000 RepID=A0A841PHW9_9BACL|nr:phosphotransferase [Geomicrobium halophilum]MBB6448339.1 spore coat protein YsxE [Geomicrobium halophilum]
MNEFNEQRLLDKINLQGADWTWISERVLKAEAPTGPIAIKRWQRTDTDRENFLHHLRYAERAGIQGVIPLMQRAKGDLPVFEVDEQVYYLEPWIEDEPIPSPPPKELRLLTILASNHKTSESEEKLSEEEVKNYKQEVEQLRQQDQLMMERITDQFEQSRFLSPFELTFLNGYPFLNQLFKEARKGFQKWARQIQEKESYRFVFCHGQPTLEHGLIEADGNAWFTNWETSGPGPPAYDLAYFYRDLSRKQPFHPLDGKKLYGTYEAYGPSWSEADTGLLKALTLTPTPILEFAESYRTTPRKFAEHQWTAMLQSKLSSLRYLHQMIQWKETQETSMKGK